MATGDWDVIVVGARCAGSPLAMLLARKGYRVLVVDRATFPSTTISTHVVFPTGLACMEHWGLLETLAATGCPPLTIGTLDLNGAIIKGGWIRHEGIEVAYCPRRQVLDKLLVDAAAAAGAEVREGFSVRSLVFDGDRAVGIRGGSADSAESEERAAIVVGADGRNSLVARAVNAAKYRDEGSRTIQYVAYWSGLKDFPYIVYAREEWGVGVVPTHDGLTMIGFGANPKHLPELRADLDAALMARVAGIPELDATLRSGRREERWLGLAEVPNYFRQSHGPGWALVGDAGYYKDPITAHGISDAFRDAEALSAAIDDGLAGTRPMDEALAAYQQRRDEVSQTMFEWTLINTGFAPTDEGSKQLFQTIASDPDLSRDFLNLNPGLADYHEVFASAAGAAPGPQ